MLKVKCLEKIRNNSHRIIGYKLEDIFGNVRDIQAAKLKEAMLKGSIDVVNLTMASDGKIIDKVKTEVPKRMNVETPIEKFLLKCRMAGIDIDNYKFNDDFTVLLKYTGQDRRIVIPPVKIIGESCIEIKYNYKTGYNNEIDEIIIPDSVEVISDHAFVNTNVKSVKLGTGLKTIGKEAFRNTHFLQEFDVPDSVTELGDGAFINSGIKRITVGNGIDVIPDYLCDNCQQLQQFKISDKTKYIGSNAFRRCVSLREIELNEGLREISYCAFADCGKVKRIIIPSTVESINNHAFSLANIAKDADKQETNIEVRSDKIRLHTRCFAYRRIGHIKFNKTITYIGNGVFDGCKITSNVVMPDIDFSVAKAEDVATSELFMNCECPSITLPNGYNLSVRTFYGAHIGELVVPKSVEYIDKMCFSTAVIDKMALPDNIKHIGESAFEKAKIPNLTIPRGVRSIGKAAYNWAGLKGDIVLSGEMSIGTGAFAHNDIKNIRIAEDFYCTSIESGALSISCDNFIVDEDNTRYSVMGKTLCNKEKYMIYACAKTDIKKMSIPKCIKVITDYAFAGIETLTDVEIRHVVRLGDGAFAYCKKLKRVILANGYVQIGNPFTGSFNEKVSIEFVDVE